MSLQAPLMEKRPHQVTHLGQSWEDPYFWFREKEKPEVIEHLNKENEYTQSFFKPYEQEKERLFQELKARIKEDDADVPTKKDNYYYYKRVEAGQEYPIFCRKQGNLSADEEVVLDVNELAKEFEYINLGVFRMSPNHQLLAYSLDIDGSEKFTIFFKDLKTGQLLADQIKNTNYSLEWANDNEHVFYTVLNDKLRPDEVYRHKLGDNVQSAKSIYKEDDTEYFVGIDKTKDKSYIVIDSGGKITSESHLIPADRPLDNPTLFCKRSRGVEYSVEHHNDKFFVRTNLDAKNFRIVQCDAQNTDSNSWQEFLPYDADHYILGYDVFEKHMVLFERNKGLHQLRIVDMSNRETHCVEFNEATYGIAPMGNPDFKSGVYRFEFSSPKTPQTTYDYDIESRKLELKKRIEIPSGHNPDDYETEWVMARSHDGVEVPISLLYKKGLARDGSNPLLPLWLWVLWNE